VVYVYAGMREGLILSRTSPVFIGGGSGISVRRGIVGRLLLVLVLILALWLWLWLCV
jgi:hypothetical protein